MITTVEQKVEYLSKILESNNETTKALKQDIEKLEGIITNRIASTASLSPSIGDLNSAKDIDEKYIDLSKENQMLNQVVKDYESTLDIIMNKYRTQTKTMQMEKQNIQRKLENDIIEEKNNVQKLMNDNAILEERLSKCLSVIREAYSATDENKDEQEVLIQSLIKENNGLKDILKISQINDDITKPQAVDPLNSRVYALKNFNKDDDNNSVIINTKDKNENENENENEIETETDSDSNTIKN